MRQARNGNHRYLSVEVPQSRPAGYNISAAGDHNGRAAVWLVCFTKAVTTRVRAGENRGISLTNRNIVTDVKLIGEWRDEALTVGVNDYVLKLGEGCAILVQEQTAGPIFGAASCPAGAGG